MVIWFPFAPYSGSAMIWLLSWRFASDGLQRVAEPAGIAELKATTISDIVHPPVSSRIHQKQCVGPVRGSAVRPRMAEGDRTARLVSTCGASLELGLGRAFEHGREKIAFDQGRRIFDLGGEARLRRRGRGQKLVQCGRQKRLKPRPCAHIGNAVRRMKTAIDREKAGRSCIRCSRAGKR